MPQLPATVVLQALLLLSALPAQYLISRWSRPTAAERLHATTRLLRVWNEWRSTFLNSTVWTEWAKQQMSKVMSLAGFEQREELTQESLQAMIYHNDKGLFGASKVVRSPRPVYVFLRVGEVVLERHRQMVGVVVSWDSELQAPQEWVNSMYFDSETQGAMNTPHYKVLFSGPAPSSLLVAYLPQSRLERVTGFKPDIPTLEDYFTHFDGEKFIMQPWLKEIFPEDEDEDS